MDILTVNTKTVEETLDITPEFLEHILKFFENSIDKVKTRGDANILDFLATALSDNIEFYNEEEKYEKNQMEEN